MFRHFLRDRCGNYLMITALVMPVLFGSLTIGIDYADMSRQCQNALNAVDAATFASGRRLLEGENEITVRKYARDFFDANLTAAKPADVQLNITLPANARGGGRISITSILTYKPHFLGAFLGLLGRDEPVLQCRSNSTVQLQNTVEVALVLDNSGSMNFDPATGRAVVPPKKSRMDLLQEAAKQLVDQLADAAKLMVQVEKPIQMSLVPFAGSVNVGAANKTAAWMDTKGVSSVHHENFDWSQVNAANKKIELKNGEYKKIGTGWGSEENQTVTRITLFEDLKQCGDTNCTAAKIKSAGLSWGGCVEARPYPYNTNDQPADRSDALFVPLFAPDEAGDVGSSSGFNSYNDWWKDGSTSTAQVRQRNGAKYFVPLPYGKQFGPRPDIAGGPNNQCTTSAITALTDISVEAGRDAIKTAIDKMLPDGSTNVPEGLAWGWRTLSSQLPFTGGRPEVQRGNDKVIITLTDGANTYYTPDTLTALSPNSSWSTDAAGNKSTYSAFGYGYLIGSQQPGRIFGGAAAPVYSNDGYTAAMNATFLKTCENANGGDTGGQGAGLIVMTIALDLNKDKEPDKTQIALLEKCASRSRYARDPADPTKGRKLFWNAKSSNLKEVFKEVADELSNMRLIN